MWNKIKQLFYTRWQFSFTVMMFLMLLFMPFEAKNHRFNMSDFEVYYKAASRIVNGENLYRPLEDGHYYYKYSPESAIYFIPVSIFNYTAARIIYWTFLSFIVCLGFYLVLALLKPDFRTYSPGRLNKMILLIGLILSVHIQRELHLGQVNHLLLVLYIGMIYLFSRGKKACVSALWAISIFIKPHGLIFLPYFIIKKQFKIVGYFFMFVVFLALTPLLFYDTNMAISQHLKWFHELQLELSYKQALTTPALHTIFSLLARYTPLRLLEMGALSTKLYQIAVLSFIGGLILYLINRGRDNRQGYILEMAFLTGLIPLLASTGSCAFGFLEIAVFIIVFNYQNLSKWLKITAVTGLVFLGCNWHDLVTHKVSVFLDQISLVAIGAVILLFVLTIIRLKRLA